MAPEQCEGKEADARADIYALGVILFEMLTGKLPFTGAYPMELLLKHVKEPPPRLMPLVPGLPMDLERVVHTALRKNPGERYVDVHAMAGALREVPLGRPASRSAPSRSRQTHVRSRPDVQPRLAPETPAAWKLAPLAVIAAVFVIAGVGWGLVHYRQTRLASLVDDAPMVAVPAGEFVMGTARGRPDAAPEHRVRIGAFQLDRHLVTNRLYRRFLDATGHRRPASPLPAALSGDDQPAVLVTWDDAVAYCRWAGKRLPTEAEWEYAARGGLEGKTYPWGDDPADGRACFGLSLETGAPKSVGRFDANGYGLFDMAGNALQWCQDWFDAGYYAQSPPANPGGPAQGRSRVARGGSWCDPAPLLACSYRASFAPSRALPFLGFRGARSLP